jgi:hypothetical protein
MVAAALDVAVATRRAIDKIMMPPPRVSTWRWAEQNVYLSSRVSPRPGMYRSDWCPYVREPQDAFDDPTVETIVLCWSTRSQKSETMLNMVRKAIVVDRDSAMIGLPSEPFARSFSETRFQPPFRDSPSLAAELPANSDHFKLLEMHFRHSSCWLVGAGSPANLKSRGVRVVAADEVDTWPGQTKKETGALQQLLERNRDRWNRKTVIGSTPTVESGQIWREFLKGDQRRYFMPCPHCGHFQFFRHRQLYHDPKAKRNDGSWDMEHVLRSTVYLCENKDCGKPITDSDKPMMLALGEWRPTAAPRDVGRRSYHLNALYPVWTTFGEVQVMFLKSNASSPEDLQRFINSWLAEPWQLYGDNSEFENLLDVVRAREPVESVPKEHVVIVSADIQQTNIYFESRAHARNRDSVGLDYGCIPGFEELEAAADKWGAFAVFVDMPYRTSEVLEWCMQKRREGKLYVPVLGNSSLLVPLRWAKVPIEGGLFKGQVIDCLRFRPNDYKDTWAGRVKRLTEDAPKWVMVSNADNDYKKQLAGEVRVQRRLAGGRIGYEWVTRGPNHYLDCAVINIAGYDAVRPLAFDVEETGPPPRDTGANPSVVSDELSDVQQQRDRVASLLGGDGLQW